MPGNFLPGKGSVLDRIANVRCLRYYMSDAELNTDNNETDNHRNSGSRARTPRRVRRQD